MILKLETWKDEVETHTCLTPSAILTHYVKVSAFVSSQDIMGEDLHAYADNPAIESITVSNGYILQTQAVILGFTV